MKFSGIRSVIFGCHNPLIHGLLVTISWKKIYKEYPNFREIVCILLHDIGYINQEHPSKENEDCHPVMGAKICKKLFGQKYYDLCIAHSRDYANKNKLQLSKLGYADKMSVIITPLWIVKLFMIFGGEFHDTPSKWGIPFDFELFRAEYIEWWNKNGEFT